jgi:two-component system CheB/CheR fusion protein
MSKIKNSEDEAGYPAQFPVVAIGASAGGLDAVKRFLEAVPAKSGMAYIFVQHQNPDHESSLAEILSKNASIPVLQVTEHLSVEADHFYIIPGNKTVTVADGALTLSRLDKRSHHIKVIDLFFSSVATVYQSFAVGVVLSGTLDDGTSGLQAIKGYGGITFAQDEASAAFKDMPQSAVNQGTVDFVMPPEKIVEHLISINNSLHLKYSNGEIATDLLQHDEEIFKQLLTVLKVRRGIDFTYYKSGTMKRRIARRMALSRIEKPEDYLLYLRENKMEQDALYNDMLISVTHFFRDPATFDILCGTIFPSIIRQKTPREAIRIWVAGCATGEEAYSMAICLIEHLGDKAAALKIQIFATDISETAIAKARMGVYRASELEGLSSSRIQQFFTKLDGSYQVNKNIRDLCVFAQHNLLKDPPFSKVDVVSCRNVMIYLEPILQKRALTTFHYALNDGGYLMLGKSENIGSNADIFSPYNSQEKIFLRKGERGRFMQVASPHREQKFHDIDRDSKAESGKQDIFKIAGDIILANYAPPGVLINETFDIIQFSGKTNTWLTLTVGRATLNLLKLAREGLAFELRSLVHQARKNGNPVRRENIIFILDNEQEYVNLEVVPIFSTTDPYYMVLFEKKARPEKAEKKRINKIQSPGTDPRDLEIEQLRKELMQTRADMRTVTEEQEAANEELQSANEELLSGSEELQSLNEELETSKEELQSTNEEITIVNNELIDRNEQLNNARKYSESIINTVRDALLILDGELRVKRATDGFYNKFKVSEQDTEGRYFYQLGNGQWNIPALKEMLENVLPKQKAVVDYEVEHVFPGIGKRVMHLNAHQMEKLDGEPVILISIEDITYQRKVEEGLAEAEQLFMESRDRLKLAVDAGNIGIWEYTPATGEMIMDQRCKLLSGLQGEDNIDLARYRAVIYPDDVEEYDKLLNHALGGEGNGEFELEYRMPDKSKKEKWLKSKGQAYFDADGKVTRMVGTSLDITLQKEHEEAIKELLRKKDDFISIASHELKTPITTLKAALQIIIRMKDQAPDEFDNMLKRASKSLDRINVLVEDLLTVSKLNHGQLSLHKTWFNMYELIDGYCQSMQSETAHRIIVRGDMQLKVFADVDRIEQVFVNFLNNAIKYAPDSEDIEILIEQEGEKVVVSVTDHGPGIPAAQQANLFERYYRLHDNNLTSGLGLGLYICTEIISRHDGTIGLVSGEGNGSTFWFSIPRAPLEA